MIEEQVPSWFADSQRGDFQVGDRVRVRGTECTGEQSTVGMVGRIIRICHRTGQHVDARIVGYVLENDTGHGQGHLFEVWAPGQSMTWWTAAAELEHVEEPSGV